MANSIAPAKHIYQRTYPVSGQLLVTEHYFEVPKDHSLPHGDKIRIFARSVRKANIAPVSAETPESVQLPWMVFLQGGPGLPCRPPQQNPFTARVLEAGYQLLLMDSRGVGLSTPVHASTLPRDPDQAVAELKLYRADSIARDLEAIRQSLTEGYPENKRKWSTMGQSFGGFVTLSYLSFFPAGLRECFLFGGLQALIKQPDELYRRLFRKLHERNLAYYRKFPEDVKRVWVITDHLKKNGDGSVTLPSGGALTRRRFLQMGLAFGGHGGLDSVHDVVLRAAADIEALGHLTRSTLSEIDDTMLFDDNPIYAILHEPIYCEGSAPNWSAHRIQHNEYPEFVLDDADPADKDRPIFFTGEMIFPWMFEDYAALRPLREAAEKIASDAAWPALFDEEQLARNEVPVYAASYLEDMYVDSTFALETAKKIKGSKVFTTNVMFHDAIRSKTEEVLNQAFALRNDVID